MINEHLGSYMACYLNENVYTHTFTPREYQVELLNSAKKRNTIVCSSTSAAKAFIIIKLLQEFSYKMRVPAGKQALFILDLQNVPIMTSHVKLLTDLSVVSVIKEDDHNITLLNSTNVIVTTAEVCVMLLKSKLTTLNNYNLIVVDCLHVGKQSFLNEIMYYYHLISGHKPRILGLTAGLLGSELQPDRLEAELQRLEKLFNSSVDTSSEILTLIRLSNRPRERIIECYKQPPTLLQDRIKATINACKCFLNDHRYDPSEIYDDELLEEFKQVPDPNEQPLSLFDDFLDILDDLGPYSADRAAYGMLIKIEKLKVKVPYERHYLLLCVASTVLISIRATCELEFQDYTDRERVFQFSSPKVLRFLEVLKQFKPMGEKPEVGEKPPDVKDTVKKGKGKNYKGPRRTYVSRTQNEDMLCALVFVKNRYTAEALFTLLCVMSKNDEEYWWVSVSFSVNKIADPIREPREAESEHKRQEEVLRKYRSHECNIMIATSVLEQGCDLPKCNLVIRFDLPLSFHSYIHSKARARANEAHFILFANENEVDDFVEKLAEYNEVENTLLKRCYNLEPDKSEELIADALSLKCKPYQPSPEAGANYVSLSNAIALVNRYCAKLPSDTFTRLTPISHEEKLGSGYTCSIRLPINSPVKKTVTSPPMINTLLARRAAAFLVCQLLHKTGELDDNLQPISKENFKVKEEDWTNFALEDSDEENVDPRPGTTKRRQYYYKKVADALLHCHPIIGSQTYFYKIVMQLTCPLPEEQNTRGRKIYPPEDSPQGFGILTSKEIPKISAFPIFTRSGEVSVSLQLCSQIVIMKDQIVKIREFLNYTFTSVLRLQKYLTLFNPDASTNSHLIVPTISGEYTLQHLGTRVRTPGFVIVTASEECYFNLDSRGNTTVDWSFIDLIYENLNVLPEIIPEDVRKTYEFDPEKYKDAVVMPWYRNQDQPQYFYVAEICTNLNPASEFPGSDYATFEEYYLRKYNIQIQNKEQHLLDVDHTSARLNFLTPRYVNRKGVALPTSSEATKRAKREKLQQKQILVPELCAIHPFSASLWRKAVCLPCILYRINALLLADQIRRTVALELNLGKLELHSDFEWPPLNFGWSLADVLKKSKEEEKKKQEKIKMENEIITDCTDISKMEEIVNEAETETSNEDNDLIEIGTWSNDMAQLDCDDSFPPLRYASPTSWMNLQNTYDDSSSFSDSDYSGDESESEWGGLRIEFTGDNVAEALDDATKKQSDFQLVDYTNVWNIEDDSQLTKNLKKQFYEAHCKNKEHILSSGILISKLENFSKNNDTDISSRKKFEASTNYEFNIDNLFIDLDVSNSIEIELPTKSHNEYDVSDDMIFNFDEQPNLIEHPGPSPNVILQALTMSNANDGINLERLETIGDSFLKYAITNYLYSKYENVHEGKLSHLRSKQVSNLNLYRLGRRKGLGEYMIATKFDPHDNWLPPCFCVPKELEEALFDAQFPSDCWTMADMAATRDMTLDAICSMVRERGETLSLSSIIPYNLVTQHSIPDKSIADCVEALIGAYLIECGPRGALLFMAWLGIRVLPQLEDGSYGEIKLPKSPLAYHKIYPQKELDILLDGYDQFEGHIGYKFRDRSYLLQSLTHASFSPNTLTDCYQRLEFLGDAVLDYLITRHLYEDSRMHSPGALTDLRSALVNNTIFASLAVRNGFHRYFRNLSPSLNEVVEKFVRLQEESGHTLVNELYLVVETEEVEDVEVPKALGDVFESVAGAIFLDSGMSLDAVWKVYYKMMKSEIEQFSNKVPKSPIRELLELEPETAKFGKPEKLADGRRVRVTVEVFGKGVFKGIGRNYRIAKCTAAKCALKNLKKRGLIKKIDDS